MKLAGGPFGSPAAGAPWSALLLLSYASAVTLALAWVLWTGRRLPPPRAETEISAPIAAASETATSDEPLEAGDDEASLPPLPSQNLTSLGEPVRLGSVEVTPLGVERRKLELLRAVDPGEARQTRIPSLLLRVRLKNVSPEWTFAPLEPSAVRECLGLPSETFVESERGKIGMYPLALQSEWALAGQEFPSLDPGESAETFLATAATPDDRLGDSLIWYARLRVSPHQTDVLGVRFSRTEIIDEPERMISPQSSSAQRSGSFRSASRTPINRRTESAQAAR